MITYTEPGLQGDRSTGGTKPATLETGAEIAGTAVHRDRREGQGRHPRRVSYLGRVTRSPARHPTAVSRAARSKARKRALDVLFESEHAPGRTRATCSRPQRRSRARRSTPYTVELVEGVVGAPGADRRAARRRTPQGWSLDRMPAVDRTVLRLGAFELLWRRRRPRRRRDRRGGRSWPGTCRPTTRRRSSTACSPGCSRSGPPLPWTDPARRATDGSACQWLPAPGQVLRSRADRYPVRCNALVLELAYSIGSNPMARKRSWVRIPRGYASLPRPSAARRVQVADPG